MDAITAYVPLAKCEKQRQYLAGQALDALKAQTVPVVIQECVFEGEIHSQRRYNSTRITGECASRNLAFSLAIQAAQPLFLMIDRDRVARSPVLVATMIAAMDADPTIGLLSAVDPRHCKNVDAGFCMIRLAAIRGIKLIGVAEQHLCWEINQWVQINGYKCEYLKSTTQLTMEV